MFNVLDLFVANVLIDDPVLQSTRRVPVCTKLDCLYDKQLYFYLFVDMCAIFILMLRQISL